MSNTTKTYCFATITNRFGGTESRSYVNMQRAILDADPHSVWSAHKTMPACEVNACLTARGE